MCISSDKYIKRDLNLDIGFENFEEDFHANPNTMFVKTDKTEEYDFTTEFPTWIIAFCPDTDSWFVTNQRFFYYEYEKEFTTEDEGVAFFKENPNIFYDEEIRMEVYRPYFRKNGVLLDNTNEFIEL